MSRLLPLRSNRVRSYQIFIQVLENTRTECRSTNIDDSEDSEFLDNDYEVQDGDDDLFVDHVDEDVEDDVTAIRQMLAKTKKAPGSKLKRDAVV